MQRLAAAVLALFALAATAGAQVVIAPADRVHNRSPGCCGLAAIETVARHQGYTQLNGITASTSARAKEYVKAHPGSRSHPCLTSAESLRSLAGSRGIRYEYSPAGSFSKALINKGIRNGDPVIVSVRSGDSGHVLAVVGQTRSSYQLYDPNKTSVPYVTMSKEKFQSKWRGSSLLIKPK